MRKNQRKGQIAVEYLFNYGWIIVLILAITFTVTSYGLLSADRFVKERCDLGKKIICKDFALDADGDLMLILTNNYDFPVSILNMEMRDHGSAWCETMPRALNPSMTNVFYCDFGGDEGFRAGEKEELDVTVNFKRVGSTVNHEARGRLIMEVKGSVTHLYCGNGGTHLCTLPKTCPSEYTVFDHIVNGSGTCCLVECVGEPQCNDGIDNDGDTCWDFGFDTGCDSIFDDTENTTDCMRGSIHWPECGTSDLPHTGCIDEDTGCSAPIPQYACLGHTFCCNCTKIPCAIEAW